MLAEASRLSAKPDPESEPYKSKYEAAEQLAKAKQQVSQNSSNQQEADEVEAVLSTARGIILLETDLRPEAEQALSEALKQLDQQSRRFAALLQQVLMCHSRCPLSAAHT